MAREIDSETHFGFVAGSGNFKARPIYVLSNCKKLYTDIRKDDLKLDMHLNMRLLWQFQMTLRNNLIVKISATILNVSILQSKRN